MAIELKGQIWQTFNDLYGNIAMLLSLSRYKERCLYTPFGETDTTFRSPWGFASKRKDPTGLIYFGKRYYSPSEGRWLTPDPLGLEASPNLYAFVSNSPLTHYDHYGLEEVARHRPFFHPTTYLPPPIGSPIALPSRQQITGGLMVLEGATQMGAAIGLSQITGGLAAPLGMALGINAADRIATGFNIAITGKPTETYSSQLLQKTGLSAEIAKNLDSSFSFAGTLAALATLLEPRKGRHPTPSSASPPQPLLKIFLLKLDLLCKVLGPSLRKYTQLRRCFLRIQKTCFQTFLVIQEDAFMLLIISVYDLSNMR